MDSNKELSSCDLSEHILYLHQKFNLDLDNPITLQFFLYGIYGLYYANFNKPLFVNEKPYIFSNNVVFINSLKIYNNVVKPVISEITTYKYKNLEESHEWLKAYDLLYSLTNIEYIELSFNIINTLSYYIKMNSEVPDQLTHKLFLPLKEYLVKKDEYKLLEQNNEFLLDMADE